jgi:hypothetical protein
MSSPTGPTPPPPQQYSSPEPAIIAPTGPGLSEPQRLINVFIAPSKTFEDLKRNPSWWVPWVISAIVSLLAAFVIVQKVDLPRLAQHRLEQSKMGQRQLEQASPADRERILSIQVVSLKVSFFLRSIFGLLFGLVIAAILMAVFNFGLAAEIPFQRAMAIVFYGSLPGLLKTVLLCLSLWFSADPGGIDPDINPVATNPGFFMDPQNGKFLYYLVSGVDVIAIWITVLLAIGFATASSNKKLTIGTALTTMFSIYAVLILVGAAVGSAF